MLCFAAQNIYETKEQVLTPSNDEGYAMGQNNGESFHGIKEDQLGSVTTLHEV